jgi:hypothetical protein
MVIKENFSRDMVDMLAHDLAHAVHALSHGGAGLQARPRHRLPC